VSIVVGRVAHLIRYPVKSMAGESIESTHVTSRGVVGDRAYALIDRETGRVVSAKKPRMWASILEHAARLESAPEAGAPLPAVGVVLPDGSRLSSGDRDELNNALSASLGRPVALEDSVPEGASFDYHWPDMEGLLYKGRYYRDEVTTHEMPPGTFFDGATLHLLTTASMAEIGRLVPDSVFDARRFRPNIVVETPDGSGGFVENGWVGGVLRVGYSLRLDVTKPCIRCVMTTLGQEGLLKDPGVLRAAFDHNEGNLGVSAEVIEPGTIRVGDEILFEA
jgi:uncharacterized protein YcbX